MQERAFTPHTTYGDTYRKAGVERKIKAPEPPAIERGKTRFKVSD